MPKDDRTPTAEFQALDDAAFAAGGDELLALGRSLDSEKGVEQGLMAVALVNLLRRQVVNLTGAKSPHPARRDEGKIGRQEFDQRIAVEPDGQLLLDASSIEPVLHRQSHRATFSVEAGIEDLAHLRPERVARDLGVAPTLVVANQITPQPVETGHNAEHGEEDLPLVAPDRRRQLDEVEKHDTDERALFQVKRRELRDHKRERAHDDDDEWSLDEHDEGQKPQAKDTANVQGQVVKIH